MDTVAIVLFFHKTTISKSEWIACSSIFQKLSERKIFVVAPKGQDIIIETMLIAKGYHNFHMISLDDENFQSTSSYNYLLTSFEFYRLFKEFDFILITQLDVLIKQDTLTYWISKNYSYIGAPWTMKDTNLDYLIVGNGGLSLRKVESFLNLLSSNFKISYPAWYLRKKKLPKFLWPIVNTIVTTKVLRNYMRTRVFEDFFFTQMIHHDVSNFNIAPADAAINFALEKIHDRVDHNSKTLLGYHAFEKYLDPQYWGSYEN